MAKRRRRSFGEFLHGAVKDVVMPTSMGLGLALGGCGSSSGDKTDALMYAVMPPGKDAAAEHHRDGYAIMPPAKDAAAEHHRDGYAIMPPAKDAAPETRDAPAEFPIYAIMPLKKDAAPETRDASSSEAIYAIMDAGHRDLESDKRDSKPDTIKPLTKDTGVIYAIMPFAVLPPPRG